MSGAKNLPDLMVLHCGKIITKMEGRTHEDWVTDENLRDAVCMRLMSLAECVKEYLKENPTLSQKVPQISWDNIVRFRDKIAHHYEGIDYDVVWEIYVSDIPPLSEAVKKLLTHE
jgi:uncharacterized protein with HEPN domain